MTKHVGVADPKVVTELVTAPSPKGDGAVTVNGSAPTLCRREISETVRII
jgi:hypothetical protein